MPNPDEPGTEDGAPADIADEGCFTRQDDVLVTGRGHLYDGVTGVVFGREEGGALGDGVGDMVIAAPDDEFSGEPDRVCVVLGVIAAASR